MASYSQFRVQDSSSSAYLFVGIASSDNRVNFRAVTITESDGKTVRVRSGLRAGEKVMVHPGESISDGEQVQPINTTSKRSIEA